MKIIKLSTTILILLLICSSYMNFKLIDEKQELIQDYNTLVDKSYCEMYNAYGEVYQNKTIATGLFWKDTDFYCVWVGNRPMEEIEQTDRHEYCHYLVDQDYSHFCLDYYEVNE